MDENLIRTFLPSYLSPESKEELLEGIEQFPEGVYNRFYSRFSAGRAVLYQGDGIDSLPTVQLPDTQVTPAPAILISNTCDMSHENPRALSSHLQYCPIINLDKYRSQLLRANLYSSEEAVDSHIDSIKFGHVTTFMYLPSVGDMDDSVVLLDRINNCKIDHLSPDEIEEKRLFSLSNIGFYFLLVKLSMHLTRAWEKVDRLLDD